MGSAIGLREDFDGAGRRRLSRITKRANHVRRLLALAESYDGGHRSAAARTAGVGLQNDVETFEKRKGAQLCREVEFALPREMTQAQGIELSRDFVAREFVD